MKAFPVHPQWPSILKGILARAAALKEKALLAFDLDSTLFDNRPRQARIMREFGEASKVPELTAVTAADFICGGWDMKIAMQRHGLGEARIAELLPLLKKFWSARFFTSPYCTDDVAIEGAADFCQAVIKTGAQLIYVTGRHEAMRDGSIAAMRQSGFPLPGEGRTKLLMKPTLEQSDDDFKRLAHAELKEMGELLAAFDNEPIHANDYRRNFPGATVIHLATDHSGREDALLEGIVSAPNFAYAVD